MNKVKSVTELITLHEGTRYESRRGVVAEIV